MRAQGSPTRGTTGSNRLRRLDRWLAGPASAYLRRAGDPLVVDLGFGAVPTTTFELARTLAPVRGDVSVVGIELDADRVAAARNAPAVAGVTFTHGGFELGGLDGRRPVIVRAANVLRQYPSDAVEPAWRMLAGRVQSPGLIVDATCDEIGRLAAWLALDVRDGVPVPTTLTLSMRLAGLERPGLVAARLPKALIHRNVEGQGVHALLGALDEGWARHAVLASFGARQRFAAACAWTLQSGWPLVADPARWRLGEVSVAADAVL